MASVLAVPPLQTANPCFPNVALRSLLQLLWPFSVRVSSPGLARPSVYKPRPAPRSSGSTSLPRAHPRSLPRTWTTRLRHPSKKWPKRGKAHELHSGAKGQYERGEGGRDQEQCRGHGEKPRGGEGGGLRLPAAADPAPAPPPAGILPRRAGLVRAAAGAFWRLRAAGQQQQGPARGLSRTWVAASQRECCDPK